MSHQALLKSEAGEYGDTGVFGVRSTRRFWIAECSCGWHAGSGLGLAWFTTKKEATAAWRDHKDDAAVDDSRDTRRKDGAPGNAPARGSSTVTKAKGATGMKKCQDEIGLCTCELPAGHSEPHVCSFGCGSSWEDDGAPLQLPDHGPHCSPSCHRQETTGGQE